MHAHVHTPGLILQPVVAYSPESQTQCQEHQCSPNGGPWQSTDCTELIEVCFLNPVDIYILVIITVITLYNFTLSGCLTRILSV